MPITFHSTRLVDAQGDQANGSITIDGASIVDVGSIQENEGSIDAGDLIITPGLIDVHTHGGGGFSLHTQDPQEIRSYAHWATSTGVTAFLAAVVGTPNSLPEAQLRAVIQVMDSPTDAAELLGVHLEGPYMSVARRGAHDPSWLRLPNDEETDRIFAITGDSLRLITVAPELPEAENLIKRLVERGVTVSIGHTDATYEQARDAIAWGATHATHCFNAMPPLQHRAPGPLGAIIEAPPVRGEIIADGVHVHPAVVRMLVRALGPERTVVITDALMGAGITDAEFPVFGNMAHIEGGVARLPDGTITGSVLRMDQGLRNMLQWTDMPLHEVVGMLTLNPARAAGVAERKGLLQAGYDADLALWDHDLQLQATICRGHLAWATPAWQTRLQTVQ